MEQTILCRMSIAGRRIDNGWLATVRLLASRARARERRCGLQLLRYSGPLRLRGRRILGRMGHLASSIA